MQEHPIYEMSVTEWFQSQAADFYDTEIQKLVPRYDTYLNSEGEYVENNPKLAVSVPINLSTTLGLVSVNGPRETYFVDRLRIFPMFVTIFLDLQHTYDSYENKSTNLTRKFVSFYLC